jgi:hypothetical protein
MIGAFETASAFNSVFGGSDQRFIAPVGTTQDELWRRMKETQAGRTARELHTLATAPPFALDNQRPIS